MVPYFGTQMLKINKSPGNAIFLLVCALTKWRLRVSFDHFCKQNYQKWRKCCENSYLNCPLLKTPHIAGKVVRSLQSLLNRGSTVHIIICISIIMSRDYYFFFWLLSCWLLYFTHLQRPFPEEEGSLLLLSILHVARDFVTRSFEMEI